MFSCIIRTSSLLAHQYIFNQIKTPFWIDSVFLARHYAMLVVTLFLSLTHVTYVTLHHTVVIKYNSSVTYRTLCHVSGHLVIDCECYRFQRELLTLRRFLPCIPSCFLKTSLELAVQPQS